MNLLTSIHVAAACTAVVLGLMQFASRKGDARHRTIGYAWVLAMAITALSSFGLKGRLGWAALGGYSPVHGLSILALASIAWAIYAALHGRLTSHRRALASTYVSLIVAGTLAVASPGRALHALVLDGWHAALAPLAAAFF